MRDETVRKQIVEALTEAGELTLLQLRSRTGRGTRTLMTTLNDMWADGIVMSEFVDGNFPRRLVYAIADERRRAAERTRNTVATTIHFPPYLYEAIRRESVDQRRNFSAQVVVMLESTLA